MEIKGFYLSLIGYDIKSVLSLIKVLGAFHWLELMLLSLLLLISRCAGSLSFLGVLGNLALFQRLFWTTRNDLKNFTKVEYGGEFGVDSRA